jgi:hypothetical protein
VVYSAAYCGNSLPLSSGKKPLGALPARIKATVRVNKPSASSGGGSGGGGISSTYRPWGALRRALFVSGPLR